MIKATRKISGPQTERFFRAFYAQEPRLDPQVADALTRRSVATFSSVRVRRAAEGSLGRRIGQGGAGVGDGGLRSTARPVEGTGLSTDQPAAETAMAATGSDAPVAAAARVDAAAAFDPFVFGLVPVCQREGRDGLLARLAGVAEIGQLRQMARAQQIALPAELRTGEVEADRLRAAIADAVVKRIADRRAAAGEKS